MALKDFLTITSALALSLGASAMAQGTENPAASDEEVVVTAQKRSEKLQDVPVAVSAYSSRQRDLMGIITANDVAKFTPGMEFNLNRVIIRGIGRATSALGTDPGVATYYDGLYSDNAGSIGGAPISVERIEVLRGPQGTLYGRNSIGGAINVISKRPTEVFEAELRQVLGNYSNTETSVSLAGPVNDWLRYRAEAKYTKRGGYIDNIAGPDRNDSNTVGYQLQLEADITDDITLWLQFGDETWPNQKSLSGVLVDPYDTTGFGGMLYLNPLRGYTVANPTVRDPFTVAENHSGLIKLVNTPKIVGHLDWDLGDMRLKYVGGWYRSKVLMSNDGDFSARDSFISPITGAFISADTRQDIEAELSSWSSEINLSSDDPTSNWTWIVGVYYGHDANGGSASFRAPGQPDLENVLSLETFEISHSNPARAYLDSYTLLKGDSWAVYGQADYRFAPEWTVTAGYRYTWDSKQGYGEARLIYFDPEGSRFLAAFLGPTIGYAVDLGTSGINTEAEWEGATAKLGLRWEPSDHTMAYASYSRGYKAGGFNLGALSTTPIDPEYVNTYEVGVKTRLFDSVQVNAAIFYNDYSDIQVLGRLPGPGGQPTEALFNADRARSYGFEAETIWKVTPEFRILFNYTYLNAQFVDFADGVQDPAQPNGPDGLPGTGDEFQDLSGNDMQGSPRNKVAINALYTIDFDAGALTLSGSYAWTDKQYYSIFNTATYQAPSHNEVDLRATWSDSEGRFDIIVYGQNVFDEVYPTNITIASTGGRMWQLADPRTFGVELQLHF